MSSSSRRGGRKRINKWVSSNLNLDDLEEVYTHVSIAEYNHAIDRGVLQQLRAKVLRLDVDACSTHELQIFKGFFAKLPRLKQLCIAKNQTDCNEKIKNNHKRQSGKAFGSSATIRRQQNHMNSHKKAIHGIFALLCKLMRTPRQCQLVSLALPGMQLSARAISNLEDALRDCSTLRELDLRGHDLSRESTAESMLRAITASESLQAISLKQCALTHRR